MAKLDNVIFCLKAFSQGEQGVSAQTILHALNPEYIPGLFSFSVIVSILDLNPVETHEVQIVFKDQNADEVVNISSPLPTLSVVESNLPQDYIGIDVSMDWNNVNLTSSGEYSLDVILDKTLIGTKKVFVKGKNQ